MNVWYYFIRYGSFSRPFTDEPAYIAYSGKGSVRDDPDATALKGQGPIPVGIYRALAPRTHPTLGPVAIPLEAHPSTETYGRSGFYIHGDNGRADYSASSGCIVCQRSARLRVAAGDIVCVYPGRPRARHVES